MSLRDDLIAAKALIDTPEKWGKGAGPKSPRWGLCAMNACGMAGDVSATTTALEDSLPTRWVGREVWQYNDDPETTHADIMALFDRAIAAAEDTTEC